MPILVGPASFETISNVGELGFVWACRNDDEEIHLASKRKPTSCEAHLDASPIIKCVRK